jgi:hypothetical protein
LQLARKTIEATTAENSGHMLQRNIDELTAQQQKLYDQIHSAKFQKESIVVSVLYKSLPVQGLPFITYWPLKCHFETSLHRSVLYSPLPHIKSRLIAGPE